MPQFVYQNSNKKKRQLAFDPDTDYDFLRIEVQVKKSKLNTLVREHSLNGRVLQYLVIPEVEQYVLDYYVNKLTGTGLYVTYDRAMKMIDESGYTKPKKERLKKIIEAVAKKHGIAKVLEQIEKGTITDLGTLKTVKRYLKEIETLGINPVTIPANRRRDNMNIEDIQSLYRTAKIKWSTHCLERMQERDIGIEDVGNCIMSGEIIEHYPDDFPHPSCLIFGYTIHHKVVLHTVVGSDGEVLYIITAYYPNTKKFMEDLKTRRNQ